LLETLPTATGPPTNSDTDAACSDETIGFRREAQPSHRVLSPIQLTPIAAMGEKQKRQAFARAVRLHMQPPGGRSLQSRAERAMRPSCNAPPSRDATAPFNEHAELSSAPNRAEQSSPCGAKQSCRRPGPNRRDAATRSALTTSLLLVQTSSRRPAARPALGGFPSAWVTSHARDTRRRRWSGTFSTVMSSDATRRPPSRRSRSTDLAGA